MFMEFLQCSSTAVIITIITIALTVIPITIHSLIRKSKNIKNRKPPPEIPGSWPIIGHLHLLSGPRPSHVTLASLAEKYGPIFIMKLGIYRTLIISNSEMAKECFTTNDKAFASRPKVLTMEILGFDYAMVGASPYGPHWRQMRKLMTLELLSNQRLVTLKRLQEQEVKRSLSGLYKHWTVNNKFLLEMKKFFEDVTINVIFWIIVKKRYAQYFQDHESEETGERWRETIQGFRELAGKFVLSDAVPFLRWLDLGGVEKAMRKTAAEMDRIADGWLAEHKQRRALGGNESKGDEDFMDVMLSILDDVEVSEHNGNTMIKAMCLSILLAAVDTTTATLTWTLSLLLNNRDVLKKAQQELDIEIGRERQVKESDTKNLVYLEAIIKESLRLYPAAPLLVPHESTEDCIVGGYHIPEGTRLFINVYRVHRDPNMWADPDKFLPERFLTSSKNVDVRGQNFEFIPFGSGRRMCPGISFAVSLMKLMLVNLLHGFHIDTPSNNPVDMSEGSGVTNFKATPLEVMVTPRLASSLYEVIH